MNKRGSVFVNRVYRRHDKAPYYFQYTDRIGRRHQKSTGLFTKTEARKFANEFVKQMQSGISLTTTLRDQMKRYYDPLENPRYLAGKATNSYGKQHAYRVSSALKRMEKLFDNKKCFLLDRPLYTLNRGDIKILSQIIVEERGQSRTAQDWFSTLKTVFSQAVDDGLITVNPAAEVKNVRYQEISRIAIPADKLAWLLEQNIFSSEEERVFFIVLITTGMRKSEALALNREQIENGVLFIDRACKSPDRTDIGLPKWNITRKVPLAQITQNALDCLSPGTDGRFFNINTWELTKAVERVRSAAMLLDPENNTMWRKMTCHVFRHSLNTNLIIENVNVALVAEYLSWEHQNIERIQLNYLHIQEWNLTIVADAIDKLYSPRENTVSFKQA